MFIDFKLLNVSKITRVETIRILNKLESIEN